MVRLALTKGRIEADAITLLEGAGYECAELAADMRGRKLFFSAGSGKIEIILAKAADVITYIEHGVCDLGIVGADTILESRRTFYEVLDLGFGRCRLALAGPAGCDFYNNLSHKIVATKYPNITKAYFNDRNVDVEIVKIEGSVELAPLLKLSDAIVDIVETGSTLRANGLEIYETIAPVSARLIVNVASIKMKKRETDEFIERITEELNKK
ncbi:MAG: ATP phosphoribosyltransferase [Eubacteriales bacterium]|jgi:ATP phosphoribosyltransferase|nr:ATP phosphoribosyltransferase [Eubacteriales bacterium]